MFNNRYMLPLVTLMVIQAVMTLATYSLPVVIPIAAPDLGMEPESVGFLVALVYLFGMMSGLFTGVLVTNLGATRVFQLLLALTAIAILLLSSSAPFVGVACAIVLGFAGGPMNPSGSYVLAPIVPVRRRSFLFSIKQCATPRRWRYRRRYSAAVNVVIRLAGCCTGYSTVGIRSDFCRTVRRTWWKSP